MAPGICDLTSPPGLSDAFNNCRATSFTCHFTTFWSHYPLFQPLLAAICSAWCRSPQVQTDSASSGACVLHLLPPVPGLTFGFQRYRGWDLAQCPRMCTLKVYRQFPLPWGHIFKKWEIGTGEYIFLTLSQWMDYFDIKFAWFLGEQFCEIKQ